jgi:hypothetical protein
MKKNMVGSLMVIASLIFFNSYGQKPAVVTDNDPGWQKIGETSASFKMQNESIVVLGADEFTAIKLKVKDAPLNIERLQVFYESGDMEEVDLKSRVDADGESRVINLKHPDRDVQKIAFTYKTVANAGGDKADVELYGLKTNQPQGSDAYRDDANEVKEDTERAAENAEREIEETGNEIEKEAEKGESDAERAADELGDDISEGANDAAAAIKDRKLKNKVGPEGETAYIDDDGNYYYINDEGKKIIITELQLKDKPDK